MCSKHVFFLKLKCVFSYLLVDVYYKSYFIKKNANQVLKKYEVIM